MPKFSNFLLALVILFAGSCILTLHSLFTAQDLVFEPKLTGQWTAPDTSWHFRAYDKKTGRYELAIVQQDQPAEQFLAQLGEIKGLRFLEILPARPAKNQSQSFSGGHFISLRSFWKVTLNEDHLILTPLASNWLEEMLKQGKTAIAYAKTDDGRCFLTASTQELQQFIAQYGSDTGAFPIEGSAKGLEFNRAAKP